MSGALRDLPVLVVDCQAGGATPAHGDLLELAWTLCTADGPPEPLQSHWIVPRSGRPVRRAVRELTGWSEACLAEAIGDDVAWKALERDALRVASGSSPVPTVIHYARFEVPFLRDLHARTDEGGAFNAGRREGS